jgi:DNA-binding NarL/FixJ family response regulator
MVSFCSVIKTNPPYNILLIDDHPKYLYRIGQFIWDSPHAGTVIRAQDAASAISLVQQFEPTVVFLDIHLAQSSGLDLISVIKAHAPDCRIFMLSNCSGEQYQKKATALGAEALLDKTYDFGKIPIILQNLASEFLATPSA